MRDSVLFQVRRFKGFPVSIDVDAPPGSVSGVLKCVDFRGCLVLARAGSWVLIKEWTAIKRR